MLHLCKGFAIHILPFRPAHPLLRPRDGKYKSFPIVRTVWCRGCNGYLLAIASFANRLIGFMAPTLQWSIDKLMQSCRSSRPLFLLELYFTVASSVITVRGVYWVLSSIVSFSNHRPCLESYSVSLKFRVITVMLHLDATDIGWYMLPSSGLLALVKLIPYFSGIIPSRTTIFVTIARPFVSYYLCLISLFGLRSRVTQCFPTH